jgi:hypothetical protein
MHKIWSFSLGTEKYFPMNLSLHAFEMEMEDDTHAYQFPPVASTKTSETLSMILDAAEAPEAVESLKELEALPLISAQRPPAKMCEAIIRTYPERVIVVTYFSKVTGGLREAVAWG